MTGTRTGRRPAAAATAVLGAAAECRSLHQIFLHRASKAWNAGTAASPAPTA